MARVQCLKETAIESSPPLRIGHKGSKQETVHANQTRSDVDLNGISAMKDGIRPFGISGSLLKNGTGSSRRQLSPIPVCQKFRGCSQAKGKSCQLISNGGSDNTFFLPAAC